MAKNYALELLEEEFNELQGKLSDVRLAIKNLAHDEEQKSNIKIENIQALPERVKLVKPVKNPAAFHVTKVLKEWLDSQPSPLSLDAFKAAFPVYKEATLKTQFYNYKRTTGRF